MRIRWRDFELPSAVRLDAETATDDYGHFSVEPFERGFGHTIGNGLRRVLLGSIEGTAITGVRIDGVEHEFKSIDGILQDVTDFVLALKKLLVQVEGEAPVTLSIEKNSEGDVTGADVECPTGVTIINPELVLCTITGSGVSFKAELTVRRGRGFVPADETGEAMEEVGLVPLDAGFSPVRRVRYAVEATRVGKFTNYDRLSLEIWTDGTVRPEMALVEAAKIYRKHLNPFVQFTQPAHGVPVADEVQALDAAAERRKERMGAVMDQPIEKLELSTRARNCLDTSSIATIRDLVCSTPEALLEIKNLGQTVLTEIEKKLSEMDLVIGMTVDEPGVVN